MKNLHRRLIKGDWKSGLAPFRRVNGGHLSLVSRMCMGSIPIFGSSCIKLNNQDICHFISLIRAYNSTRILYQPFEPSVLLFVLVTVALVPHIGITWPFVVHLHQALVVGRWMDRDHYHTCWDWRAVEKSIGGNRLAVSLLVLQHLVGIDLKEDLMLVERIQYQMAESNLLVVGLTLVEWLFQNYMVDCP